MTGSRDIVRSVSTLAVAGALVAAASGAAAAAVSAAPTISSLSTVSGPVGGHARLTVHGTGFTGVSSVLFGGAKGGAVHVVSSRVLTVVVPAHKAARLDLRIVTSHGTSKASQRDVYAYVAAPVVRSVSVASGVLTGGVQVVVKGSGFTHVKKVLFGKAAGTKVHIVSGSSLSVLAPAHVAGRVDIRVVSSYGTSPVKAADRFTFVAPPVVVVPSPVVTTTTLPPAERGQRYAASVGAANAGVPYTVTAVGLPPGLTLTPGGALSGVTFAAAKTYPVTITVVSANGESGAASLVLLVKEHAGQVFAWGTTFTVASAPAPPARPRPRRRLQ